MNDELYAPVPEIDAYLERIGIDRAKEPTESFLDELIYAHQHSIPFENLDISENGLTPSLGIADLYDKIVVRKRGGYCFELNALFGALLKALGFDTRPCMARVLFRPIPHPLISHRANIVTIGGRRFVADVGFGGPQPTFAPILEDGASRTEEGQTFTLHRSGHGWWDMGYCGTKEEERLALRICTLTVGEEDFVPLSFYQANFPGSVFRQNRMVNIKTADGARDLRNTTFTVFSGTGKVAREIADGELDSLLQEQFGIAGWR